MDRETVTLVTAIIGAVCGVTGALLGVFNTWHQLQRNNLRLRVKPFHAIPVGANDNGNINFGIEVTNLSEFPVVVVDVGLMFKDKRKATLLTVPGRENNGNLPTRLEPRTLYSKWFWLDSSVVDLSMVKCAYATTACGEIVEGTSEALLQILKKS